MVYPRLVFLLIQQDTPFLLYLYATSEHSSGLRSTKPQI